MTLGNVFPAALLIGSLALCVPMTRDALQRYRGTGLMLGLGFLLIGIGEKAYGEGSWRLPLSGVGLLIVLAAVGLRYVAWQGSTGGRKEGHQIGLAWSGVAVGSLAVYALTLSPITGAFGLEGDTLEHWNGVWRTLFPIVALLGVLPTWRVDQLLAVHPVIMPAGAARSAQILGVTAALAISLMFPLNYLAKQHDEEVDVAYFRTTRPGESTEKIIAGLAAPVEVLLFYPAGNDVAAELKGYFDALAKGSQGQLTYRVVDQAFDPKLAEELKIRENGQVVFKAGDVNEKLKVDVEMDRAKSNLRKLDSLVQKNLMKLTQGARTVYFVEGHGEANWRDGENPFRKINTFKKDILEALNFKVKTLGLADGLGAGVPDDANIVVVAAPTTALLPEELASLKAYWDKGGAMLLLADPTSKSLDSLISYTGVDVGHAQLANAEAHARFTGGPADNVLIATNKYGSHPAVKTLSRNSQVAHMIFPQATWVQKAEATTNKVTTLIRTLPNTWADENRNFQADETEQKKVYELAVAVTKELTDAPPRPDGQPAGAEKVAESRAIVVGNVGFVSDVAVLQANAVFARDSVLWLDHDEEITGEVESEEDVKVQHTQEEDWVWFLTTIVFVPAAVLGAGALFIRLRRKS